MGNIIRFAEARSRLDFSGTKATFSVREIGREFGLSEQQIRRWIRRGLVQAAGASSKRRLRFDSKALGVFRRVRELRRQGLSFRQIEAQFHGQLSLFPAFKARIILLPSRLGAFEKALLLHEKGDSSAAELYRKAALEDDHASDAYCNLGILDFEAGNAIGAFNNFTQALRQDPRHFESHFNLAHLYFESGDLLLAKLHYEIAAEIEPDFADLYYNLGLVHSMAGEWQRAAKALSQAKELAPEDEGKRIESLLSGIEKALSPTDSSLPTPTPPSKNSW